MKIPRKKMQCEVPSVAMGDIAFNLLIFFVILANATDDSHLKWQMASTPKIEDAGESKVSIVLDDQNKLYVNGKQLGISQLKGQLEKELQDTAPGKRTVLLKVNKSAVANLFQPIIEAVSEAGGEMVHVLGEEPQVAGK